MPQKTKQASTVRADRWVCTAGNLDNLKLQLDVDIGALPEEGAFATVKVDHFGLNFADMFACLGLYSATPEGEFVPGLEFSGVIEAVNAAGASKEGGGFKKGDVVFGVTRFGGYTSRINADLRYVRKLPKTEKWDTTHGAAFPAQALTAWYGLVELGGLSKRLGPESVVFVQSGAGGTGLWAVKIAEHFGAKCIATVGSASKVKTLSEISGLPVGHIIDRSQCASTNDINVAIKTALNAAGASGFTHIFDSLLGEWFAPSHEALQPMGRHIVLGAASMTPSGSSPNWLTLGYKYLTRPLLDPLAMISTNKALMAFNLIWLYEKVDEVDRMFEDLIEALPSMGKPHVGHQFDCIEDLPAALKLFQSGKTVGKVVVSAVRAAEREAAEELPSKRGRK